jgi:cobalt-zinc-cadmium efflux system outer membrane protein
LPFWDRNIGSIETSSAREQQAKAGLLTAEAEVESRITQNFATLQAKRTEIDTLQANELTTARETAELADRNYKLGAVP